ncbi:NAD-dependent epimerase/dehydratase family protein [Pseudomonas koreensis]|uniref:NAD-dependent epimerase/dehydratase family protein n=1 Tax=Pseudomonas koreensis TaxID=198620 RepID=UPI003F853995
MRILIIGGTGFIGREVCRTLADHDLWVLHRGQTNADLAGVRHIQGDRQALGAQRHLLSSIRADVVLDMTSINGGDAKDVIDCLAGLVGRAVVVSSGSVYRSFGILAGVESAEVIATPSREDSPLRQRLFPYRHRLLRAEDDPWRWFDHYEKILVERAYLQQQTLPATIIRLPMVYGPGDPDSRLSFYLRRMLDQRESIVLHQSGAAWRNSRAFVSNVAQAIATLVLHESPGSVYNVAEPGDWSEADWIRALGREVGWTGTVRTLADGVDWRARPSISELPEHSNFAQHLRLDSSCIRDELGYAERVTPEEALRLTVQDLLSRPMPAADYRLDDALLQELESGGSASQRVRAMPGRR